MGCFLGPMALVGFGVGRLMHFLLTILTSGGLLDSCEVTITVPGTAGRALTVGEKCFEHKAVFNVTGGERGLDGGGESTLDVTDEVDVRWLDSFAPGCCVMLGGLLHCGMPMNLFGLCTVLMNGFDGAFFDIASFFEGNTFSCRIV